MTQATFSRFINTHGMQSSSGETNREMQGLSADTAACVVGGSEAVQKTRRDVQLGASAIASADHAKWSDSLQAVLEQPPANLPKYMIMGGVLFTAIVAAWSWFGHITEVSFAEGQVAPQGDVYKVQTTTGGEVTSILAKEGELVEQGQKIASLDHDLIEKEINRLRETLNTYRLNLSQKEALIQQTQLELTVLNAMSQADISSDESSLIQEKTSIKTQEQMLDQLETDRAAQVVRLRRLEELVEKGAFSSDQLFQLEQALRSRELSITEAQGNIDKSQATVTQLEAELAQTEAVAERQHLEVQEKLQQLEIEATNLQSKINETKILLDKSRTELTQTVLTAPVGGIVSSLEVANIGEVLQPGETIAEVAPRSAPLVISALLPSQEAGLVEVGMPVNIKFDAFPYQDYGVVGGSVRSISPDARVDEQIGVVYEVEVTLENEFIEDEQRTIPLRPGQTATVEIVVDRRRIISVIFDPIRRLQTSDISL